VVQLELFQLPMGGGGGGSPLLAACSRELDGSCCASAPSFLNLTKQAPILPTSGPPLLPASDREMSLGGYRLGNELWPLAATIFPRAEHMHICSKSAGQSPKKT
jgi:hypothetical protein